MKCGHKCLLLIFVLVLGIVVIMPSAFAATVHVAIMPGSGSGQDCAATTTCFNPSILDIAPEDTVTWTNDDNMAHDLTDGLPYGIKIGKLFESGAIVPAMTYSYTFQNSDDFRYFAKDTKWMVG